MEADRWDELGLPEGYPEKVKALFPDIDVAKYIGES